MTDYTSDDLRSAVRATEFEIMASALGVDESELPNAPSEAIEGGDDFGDPEGWDGEPLGPEEIAAANLYNTTGINQDRPLRHAEEVEYEGQLAQAHERIAQLEAHNAELYQRADPQLQERIRQQREELYVQMIADPDRVAAYIGVLNDENQRLKLGRLDAAMEAGHRHYGDDFRRAYHAFSSMDPNNPTARQVFNDIMHSADPGESLMQWYEVVGQRGPLPPFLGGSGGPGMRLPSLNSQARGGRGGGHARMSAPHDYEATTNWDQEDEIMRYALGTPTSGGGGGGSSDEEDIFAYATRR
jgi:hypothetical protein